MSEKPLAPTGTPHRASATVNGQSPAPASSGKARVKGKGDEHRDSVREICETVVFVVVLVLMLKTFVAEAFVIPTGSMAETLYGYQRMVDCPQCGYRFPVSCSNEVDPQHGRAAMPVTGCFCPNCQNPIRWELNQAPSWSSGDRVLVAKFLFDRDLLGRPHRHQIFVFKYPSAPQQGTTAMNYIKRCEGEPGETILICDGDLYVTKSLTYPERKPSEDPLERWKPENMYICDQDAVFLFSDSMQRMAEGNEKPGDFTIIRKPPAQMLAVRRIVFNNDHQPKDLIAKGIRRWQLPDKGHWAGDNAEAPTTFSHKPGGAGEATEWMTYAHLLGNKERLETFERELERERKVINEMAQGAARGEMERKLMAAEVHYGKLKLGTLDNARGFTPVGDRQLISNIMGYNSGEGDGNQDAMGHYWVSDLMLELNVKVEDTQGEFSLELSKGIDRFRAVFDIASGKCRLQRLTGKTLVDREKSQQELAQKPTTLKGKGNYHVRFANFDGRLTVWVDRSLPFGAGAEYTPAKERGPISQNDIEAPAQVGVSGASVTVSHLTLWRDTFYTFMQPSHTEEVRVGGEPSTVQTFYVQPGHYLALGDNSASSADSREWGLVPERLLLGRALMVYFPFWPFNQRAGFIR